MGDAGSMSVLAQDTLTGAGVQTVTGAKTFNDQKLVLRNPANTFSLTMRNPAITANADTRINQPYSYVIFREGSTAYLKNNQTGEIVISTPTSAPELVFTTVTPLLLRKSCYVCAGSYSMSAAFTGIVADQVETTMVFDPGALITVPQGFTGSALTVKNMSVAHFKGGRWDENGTPAKLWTGIDLNSIAGASVNSCTFEDMYIRHAGNAIRLHTETSGWVNGNLFKGIFIDTSIVAVLFEHTGAYTDGASGSNNNMFLGGTIQAGTGMTHGFKDINGRRNQFINNYVADFTGSQITMNITANARFTDIVGGTLTGVNFADLTPAGSETTISDWVVGDIKRNRKSWSYEDQVAMTAPASPSTGIVRRYTKTLDANNDGLFYKSRVNGAVVEVAL